MESSIVKRLLEMGEKHKGTDLGGLLQVAAHNIEDLWESVAEKDREITNLLADCTRMHRGLINIDNSASVTAAIAFGHMPQRRYAVEEESSKRKKAKK